MHAVAGDSMVLEREDATRTVVYTTLYDLIAAVDAAIEPGEGRPLSWAPSAHAVAGEEDLVAPIVAHLLRAGHAQFVGHVDREMLWDDQAPTCLHAEERCVPA